MYHVFPVILTVLLQCLSFSFGQNYLEGKHCWYALWLWLWLWLWQKTRYKISPSIVFSIFFLKKVPKHRIPLWISPMVASSQSCTSDNITAVRGQGAEDGHLDVPDFDTLKPGVVFSTRVRTLLVRQSRFEHQNGLTWDIQRAARRGAAVEQYGGGSGAVPAKLWQDTRGFLRTLGGPWSSIISTHIRPIIIINSSSSSSQSN